MAPWLAGCVTVWLCACLAGSKDGGEFGSVGPGRHANTICEGKFRPPASHFLALTASFTDMQMDGSPPPAPLMSTQGSNVTRATNQIEGKEMSTLTVFSLYNYRPKVSKKVFI